MRSEKMQSVKPSQSAAASKHDELSERLLPFAVRIGKLVNALPANRLGRHVAGQLIRAGHCTTAQLRRSPCSGEPRRFRSQVEHRFERTSRVPRLASVHHSGRAVEANIGPAASGRMRGTLSHHWKIHSHGEDARDEASHNQLREKCKMISAKCKMEQNAAPRSALHFAFYTLH